MKKQLLVILLIYQCYFGLTQQTMSGYIYDSETKEALIGARLYSQKYTIGTKTNVYGYYSITIPTQDSIVSVEVSLFGYQTQIIDLNSNTAATNITLSKGITLESITVTGDKSLIKEPEMGTIKLTPKEVKLLPNMFGEVDIIKAFQLTPGVESGGEGKSHLIVRGGSPDQNLILLDNVPIYNPSHFGGFFSVFNVDAINSVKLIKGGFPSRYGGKLSSVLDIQMREGNMNIFTTTGSIGLLSTKLAFEGPIIKNKMSFLISGRKRSLPIFKMMSSGISYDFYDLNLKLNYKISDKDRVYLSSYMGNDVVSIDYGSDKTDYNNNLKWGNKMVAFRWNHIFTKKIFGYFTLYNSNFTNINSLQIKNSSPDFSKEVKSKLTTGVNDLGLKYNLSYLINSKYNIKLGINSVNYTFTPNNEEYSIVLNDDAVNLDYVNKINAFENSVYMENEIKTLHFSANIGLRYSTYIVNNQLYDAFEPRVLLNYIVTENLSVKYAFTKMTQYMHLLTTSSVGTPNDFWMPSTENIKPETSSQHALSFSKIFADGKYDLTLEGYHKSLSNLITFKPGASLVGNLDDWENVVESQGTGTNYGLELFLKKNKGQTTGWLSFTLSKASRQFQNINNNELFPYKYDRLINTSVLINYKFSERVNLSATWIYATGQPVTLASQIYVYNDEVVLLYDSKNSSRMRDYHRLDLALNITKDTKWGSQNWSFSVLNVYSRKNPYYYYYEQEIDANWNQGDLKLYQRSLFGILPSVSYSFVID